MKKDSVYMLLIAFIIFLVIKKITDLVIDVEFPTYKPPPTGIWKDLVYFRDILSFLSIVVIVIILLITKGSINIYINIFLYVYLVYDILYFLIDKGIIFNFVEKNNVNLVVIEYIDKYLNSLINVLLSLFCFYSFVYIFFNK